MVSLAVVGGHCAALLLIWYQVLDASYFIQELDKAALRVVLFFKHGEAAQHFRITSLFVNLVLVTSSVSVVSFTYLGLLLLQCLC